MKKENILKLVSKYIDDAVLLFDKHDHKLISEKFDNLRKRSKEGYIEAELEMLCFTLATAIPDREAEKNVIETEKQNV